MDTANICSWYGYVKSVQQLFDSGADFRTPIDSKMIPLRLAYAGGHALAIT